MKDKEQTMSESLEKYDLDDLVMKIIGPIEAVGNSHVDDTRLKNLKIFTQLIDRLLFNVSIAARTADSPHGSMRAIGKHAKEFLDELRSADNVGDNVYCVECGGYGRTSNHVTGEVECSACEGAGILYAPAEDILKKEAVISEKYGLSQAAEICRDAALVHPLNGYDRGYNHACRDNYNAILKLKDKP